MERARLYAAVWGLLTPEQQARAAEIRTERRERREERRESVRGRLEERLRDPLDLFLRIITVSLETIKVVRGLPELRIQSPAPG